MKLQRTWMALLVSMSSYVAPGVARSTPVTIDFDDGIVGEVVGERYAAVGVSLPNARFRTADCNGSCGPVGGQGIHHASLLFHPTPADPIVIHFTEAVASFSAWGVNVGQNGLRIDAYDAAIGGFLVGFAEDFGIDAGVSNNVLLRILSPGIRRVEIYQPLSESPEGAFVDVLSFDRAAAVREPGTSALILAAIALLVSGGRRRIANLAGRHSVAAR